MARTSKRVPPYVSYRTFESLLDSLRASGVPNRIERSSRVMASKSGSSQAALLSAIHYLGLIDDDEKSTPALEQLAEAKGAKRAEVLREIVISSYSSVFKSKLNLEKATTDELSEIFEKEGVTGEDTLRKCVTFFCLAAKAGGIKLSSYIKPYAGRRRRPKQKDSESPIKVGGTQPIDFGPAQSNWDLLLSKFPDFDPAWPEDLRRNWLEGFERLSSICRSTKADSTNGHR